MIIELATEDFHFEPRKGEIFSRRDDHNAKLT